MSTRHSPVKLKIQSTVPGTEFEFENGAKVEIVDEKTVILTSAQVRNEAPLPEGLTRQRILKITGTFTKEGVPRGMTVSFLIDDAARAAMQEADELLDSADHRTNGMPLPKAIFVELVEGLSIGIELLQGRKGRTVIVAEKPSGAAQIAGDIHHFTAIRHALS
jgi:hypothetical protein